MKNLYSCFKNHLIYIKKLLDRIRWDFSFSQAYFELEYEDRVSGLVRIALDRIVSIDSQYFTVEDQYFGKITIPLHRIRKVYRNGELIWRRKPKEG
jgi:uncharacterized protein (UPF0248 family)